MKKNTGVKSLLIATFLTFSLPFMANANSEKNTENSSERVAYLQSRLEEIKEMDIQSLSRVEKRALRVEVRAIKKEMAEIRGGIYISAGVLLLVLLLLLLL